MRYQVSELLTPEEERANALLWHRDRNPEGIKRLVEGNHRFVVAQARMYSASGLELDDLVAEGTMGLIEAAKRFDPDRPVKFLSFAGQWVRGAMGRALARSGHTIFIPEKPKRLLRRLLDAERRLGEGATTEALAEALGVSTAKVEEIRDLKTLQAASMDSPLGEEDGLTLAARIADDQPTAEESARASDARDAVRIALAKLPERVRLVLELRFGLETGEEMTLTDIGTRLGISRERVRQIECAGMKRLAENRNLQHH